jgi:hypothetical protein
VEKGMMKHGPSIKGHAGDDGGWGRKERKWEICGNSGCIT